MTPFQFSVRRDDIMDSESDAQIEGLASLNEAVRDAMVELTKHGAIGSIENACLFLDLDEVDQEEQRCERLTIPAVYLAEGLATDWWSILCSRDWEHRIQRYRTGFALPDIVFQSHGSKIEVTSGRHLQIKNPLLRFDSVRGETISRLDAEAVFSRFIEKVVAKLNMLRNVPGATSRWCGTTAVRVTPPSVLANLTWLPF